MSTICCSEDQLQFFSGKKARPSLAGFHEALELNPTGNTGARTLRRLLLQRGDPLHCDCSLSPSEAYALRRFLPSNREDDDEESPDDYACDDFRMYEFKVRRCTRSRSHDWTDCPFAHPGEKARRRDPRRYNYSGTVCPDFRKGGCRKGDFCEFAHGVFECWLHPERYRTQPCKDGRSCRRKVCFFAHTPQQLRIIPLSKQVGNALSPTRSPRCYTLCSSHSSLRHPFLSHGSSSPDSPLMVGASHFSPPSSPPLSSPVSPVPAYFSVYHNMLTDLSSSIEALDINSIGSAHSIPRSAGWAPLSSFEERNQSAYSTSMPSAIWRSRDEDESIEKLIAHKTNINNKASIAANDPDFDWVNELLM